MKERDKHIPNLNHSVYIHVQYTYIVPRYSVSVYDRLLHMIRLYTVTYTYI